MIPRGADVALVIRACASRYPSTIHQANILAEQGCQVLVLEAAVGEEPENGPFHPGVRRVVVNRIADFNEPMPTPWARLAGRHSHRSQVRRILRETQPRVIIACDIDSLLAVGPWVKAGKVLSIAHLHELPPDPGRNLLLHWRSRQAMRILPSCSFTLLPDPFRAAILMATWRLPQEPLVVYNCPRLTKSVTPTPFAGVPAGKPVVLYQGVVAASREILPVVQSMAWWPSDVRLVLRGVVVDSFARELAELAQQMGVAERIHLIHQPAYSSDTIATTAIAKVGVALYQNSQNLNTRFSAFASNKIFEYIAAGVPILAPDAFGYRELIRLQQLGECVDSQNPQSIGEAVASLLKDRARWKMISERARQLHLDLLNYDYQFRPVLDRILAYLHTKPRTRSW